MVMKRTESHIYTYLYILIYFYISIYFLYIYIYLPKEEVDNFYEYETIGKY